jgi:hypothetical protein
MHYFQKQVRRDVKRGITIEGVSGVTFIINNKVKFSSVKDSELAVLIKIKGPAFEGRVRVIKIPEGMDGFPYWVTFLKRIGWTYKPVKKFKGVHAQQLTAVLDAVVSGTAEVEAV